MALFIYYNIILNYVPSTSTYYYTKFDTFIIFNGYNISTYLLFCMISVKVKPMLNIRFRNLVCLFKICYGNYLTP